MLSDFLRDLSSISDIYQNINVNDIHIPFMAIGKNGVFVFLSENQFANKRNFDSLKNLFKITSDQFFGFTVAEFDNFETPTENNVIPGYFYNNSSFIFYDDIVEAYANCYLNHMFTKSQIESFGFKEPVDFCQYIDEEPDNTSEVLEESQIDYIKQMIINTKQEDKKYITLPDGRMKVKKFVSPKIGPFDTLVNPEELYFDCSDIDGNKFFLIALLGGILGAHHYVNGNYLKGIFYTLTLGGCGALYIMDLIMIICGIFEYKKVCIANGQLVRTVMFSRPVTNKRLILSIIPAAIIAFLIVFYLYVPALQGISTITANVVAELMSKGR